MKRIWLILRLSMVMMAVLFPSSLVAAEKGGPKILIPETTWYFGKIPESSVVSHAYWIKNVGTDTLKITEVKTSCGCTKAPLNKKELVSGDSTQVELIFTAGSFTGKVGKNASITSNYIPKQSRFWQFGAGDWLST
jgi:hypothetical protein